MLEYQLIPAYHHSKNATCRLSPARGNMSLLLFRRSRLKPFRDSSVRLIQPGLHTIECNGSNGIHLCANGLIDVCFRLTVDLAMNDENGNRTNNHTNNETNHV